MAQNPVRIKTRFSPNPNKQENYTIICRSYRVRTIVTSKPAVVRRWVFTIRHRYRFQYNNRRLVVGLGVHWAPGRNADAATLQLCVGHDCLVFQLIYAARTPAVLRRLLSDPAVILVGIWNYRDAALLAESHHRLRVHRLVDVREAASGLRGCSRGASTERLAAEILGLHGVVKEEWVGRSEWDDEWLSSEQVKYACTDAFLAFLMAKELKIWGWVMVHY